MFLGVERPTFMKSATLLVESTPACGQTPQLLVLLEELATPYEFVSRPAGYFFETYGRPGPRLVDGDLTLFELAAMLRHCARTRAAGRLLPRSPPELARVDAWLELAGLIGMTARALRREEREQGQARRPERVEAERAQLSSIVQALERALDDSDGDWLLGDFGVADCALVGLPTLGDLLDFRAWPRVRSYCERLRLRPAVARIEIFLRASPGACLESSSCSIS